MARRYRYAFVKKKEAIKGKWSVAIAIISLLFFVASVFVSSFLEEQYGYIVGGLALFSALLSVYGFLLGMRSFSEARCTHRTSIIGSIGNGSFMLMWLVFFLMGMS